MIHYNDKYLRKLEKEILFAYDCSCGVFEDYTHHGCLLELRKNILNEQALTRKNQEELLPYIVAFNDALHDALKYLYDRAHELYTTICAIQPGIELEAKCLLANQYPSLHPFQNDSRQELWEALSDTGLVGGIVFHTPRYVSFAHSSTSCLLLRIFAAVFFTAAPYFLSSSAMACSERS